MHTFKVRDLRNKQFFQLDDQYLNGYARNFDPSTTVVYLSLCRHADKEQSAFPSEDLIAEEHNISRRTVISKLKILKDWNLVNVKRERNSGGKWLRNTYFLLDKTEWRKLPSANIAHSVNQVQITTNNQVQQFHTKYTHYIKDTHILSKDNTKQSFGNPEINELIVSFKEKFGLDELDGSIKQNRQYAQLIIKKFGGKEKVLQIIDLGAKHVFWADKITSFSKLYYKAMEIIKSAEKKKTFGLEDTKKYEQFR